MADIKLKSVDKNRIGEYIGECRSVFDCFIWRYKYYYS